MNSSKIAAILFRVLDDGGGMTLSLAVLNIDVAWIGAMGWELVGMSN